LGWIVLVGLVAVLGVAFSGVVLARRQQRAHHATLNERRRAESTGAAKAELQHPVVDLSNCLGCGSCVRACPEEGVLELLHGQAVVVRGSGCVGTASCERECPTGAITVQLADLATRRDVPVVDEGLEAVGRPGLFLAGEVTAHALVKTAVDHGVLVARRAAERAAERTAGAAPFADDAAEQDAADDDAADGGLLDLVVVGAGPGGLACALEARRLGLRFRVLERERDLGGTVARYPRRKLVATQPIDLPLFGRLSARSYAKEELIALWKQLASEHELPIACGETFEGVDADGSGAFTVRRAGGGAVRATSVCLAIGRRGLPRQLGVPGEELGKVAYSLLDADGYTGRRILVVGGGDSAVEAALGLAARGVNEVTLSYRRSAFFRLKPSNERRIAAAAEEGRVRVLFDSRVTAIEADRVHLEVAAPPLESAPSLARDARGTAQHGGDATVTVAASAASVETLALRNDDVFVMVGGTPPVAQLEAAGVSFDPGLRATPPVLGEQGTGLVRALGAGFAIALFGAAFALWHADYYFLPAWERAAHPKHDLLRPGLGLGLWLGVASIALVLANLLYVVRRSPNFRLSVGSLASWMTVHVATGVLALLTALVHAGLHTRDTVGGAALWALVALFATGAIGRYLYAWVPRAANGRELELAELKGRLARIAEGFDRVDPRLATLVRDELGELVERRQWRATLPARLLALAGAETGLRRLVRRVRDEGRASGLSVDQVEEVVALARRSHRSALMTAHLDDLRAIMSGWRWLHRWGALAMIALVVLHVVYALAYGAHLFGGAS